MRFTIERGTVPAQDRIHERVYDQFGDLVLEISPRGNAIAYERDASGRVFAIERKPDADPSSHGERTFYILDGAGQVLREELQSWTGSLWQTASAREYVRTSACQVDKVILGAGSATPSVTEQKFDCNGSLLAEWDGNHPSMSQTAAPSRSYVYDDLNRPSSVAQPWGGAGGGNVTETYEYDVQDHRTRLVDSEGNVSRQVWSDRDLVTEEVSEVSGTVTYTYDEHGELETSTDARGVTVMRTLDAADRVTLIDYPDAMLDVRFTYDDPLVPFSKGRLTKIERAGHEIAYEWNVFGEMTRDGELTYQHDANGNREEIGYPGGVSARYTFDFSDREATLEVAVPGEPVQPVVTASSYLPLGPLASLTLGNGLTETRSHDARYYPDRIRVAGAAPLLDWDYTVDAVGNPTAIADLLSPSQSRAFGYQDFQYFLTLGNGPWGNLSWTYDRIGSRMRETRGGVADLYSYVPNMAGGHSPKLDEIQLGAGGTKVYSFDAAGNQTQVAAGADVVDMVYDDASQLASIARPAAGVRSEMLYDGRGFLHHAEEIRPDLIFADGFETGGGACWSVVVGGASGGGACPGSPMVAPVYSSEGVLHYHLKGGGLGRHVLHFSGRPVLLLAVPTAGQVGQGYLATDHLGTPILASDPLGSASWLGGFEPFGVDFSGAVEADMYLGLPGQWEDDAWADAQATGLLYNVARWYQSSVGKYDRVDPMGARGDSNPYIYAQGNPLVYFDLLGEKSRTCCAPIAGGPLAAFKHCFIHVQDDVTGEDTTYSLHGMGSRRRAWGGPLGCTFKDDGFDKRAIGKTDTECGSWAGDCGPDECVRRQFESYPRATSYSLLGPNSNTFAGTITRACGLEAPPIAGGWQTPGWSDAPAPVANGKACPDRR
ncbi:MAG: hypothetical protein HC897_02845 [Thermoanaerobaculia bacterium]|nr:hypothetical protein [Thermoanaerobaculia bacterium]